MNNTITVNGTQKFMGHNIPVILGGFGEGKKCISDKTIAEIHGVTSSDIRKTVGRNVSRFQNYTDLIDLKSSSPDDDLLRCLGYSKQQIIQATHIYILSERGYAKLVKIMDTDLAWEVHDKLIDEYFQMREELNSLETIKANLLLKIYNGGLEAVGACKELNTIEVKEAVAPLELKIEEDKPLVDFATHVTDTSDTVDVGEFAKIISGEKIDIGRNRLFKWLRKNKYLMDNNLPYQTYIDRKWFEVIETVKHTAYGINIFSKTLITGRGQVALMEKLRDEIKVN